ncbi:MAG: 50S ribosomal protein L25/general stress protein Ctc [Hyphomonadaceae bacterium]|nr:50S ribosomal protein L25/general stress protein Ctc [Hyphomonadaceae bacterium]
MAGIVLNVERREKTGTGNARATRRGELLPGVLYGGERGSVPIELKLTEVLTALRSGKFVSHLVEIDHKGERQPVIPRAIQYHPVSERPIHIDLFRVEENTVVTIDVPVHFKNQEASPGIKRGGALNIVRHTIPLRVKANAIPEEIVIDLTGADIGYVLHISAVDLPYGAKPALAGDFTIATIAGRQAEAEETTAAAAAPAEGAAPAADAAKKEPEKK